MPKCYTMVLSCPYYVAGDIAYSSMKLKKWYRWMIFVVRIFNIGAIAGNR